MQNQTYARRRNLEEPTGEAYNDAFSQTELVERGWTTSMIKRHLGPPNAITNDGFIKYQYCKRRVYAAEGTPAFHLDLLALQDVRLMGLKWLEKYRCYIPALMRSTLLGIAEKHAKTGDLITADAYRQTAQNIPDAKRQSNKGVQS